MLGVHAIATQRVERSLPDFVLGKFRHKVGVVAVVGARYSHIGFAAAPDNIEGID